MKRLASVDEMRSPAYSAFMKELNALARTASLQEYTTYCRLWEYPWAWMQLESLKQRDLSVLDIGSEFSPLPWYLAMQGFRVTVSDLTARFWWYWGAAAQRSGARVERKILDAQAIDLPAASLDVYQSISVIEHVPDKRRALEEAARVLKPSGMLLMTFDICEPQMGMTFPDWNGRALSMREFDELVGGSAWFEPGLSDRPWNTEAIGDFLAWNRTTAPHHNYVVGAAVLRRNAKPWPKSAHLDALRSIRGKCRAAASVTRWACAFGPKALRHRLSSTTNR
jgi:SAM-dependent methyltransferase